MSQTETAKAMAAEERTEETWSFVRTVKAASRRKYTPEEKIRIVVEGFQREATVSDLCRREGIKPHSYYAWTKEFMEAGKGRLTRDAARDATQQEVQGLRRSEQRGLDDAGRGKPPWNRLTLREVGHVLSAAREMPELSPRQLASWVTDNVGFSVSDSTVYRILRREGLVKRPEMRLAAARSTIGRPPDPTRCGRPTPPTSGWSAGATTTWSPSWTTTPASSLRQAQDRPRLEASEGHDLRLLHRGCAGGSGQNWHGRGLRNGPAPGC